MSKHLFSVIIYYLVFVSGLKSHEPVSNRKIIFPDIKGTGVNGEKFAERCLNEAGVALIPGTAFGKFAINNVRINFTISEENISNALEKINNMLG